MSETIANLYSAGGWTVKTVNDYSLVVEKPAEGVMPSLLFGSRFAGTPNVRVTLQFASIGNATRVTTRVEMVTNPGSGFEKTADVSSGALDLQKELELLKTKLEGGVIGIMFGEDLVITDVTVASPAAIAGLLKGDKIFWVKNQLVGTRHNTAELLAGSPGESVEVKVIRGGEQVAYTIERKRYTDVYDVQR